MDIGENVGDVVLLRIEVFKSLLQGFLVHSLDVGNLEVFSAELAVLVAAHHVLDVVLEFFELVEIVFDDIFDFKVVTAFLAIHVELFQGLLNIFRFWLKVVQFMLQLHEVFLEIAIVLLNEVLELLLGVTGFQKLLQIINLLQDGFVDIAELVFGSVGLF
jgi:hypothetical protein